jgi:hypothetical protein
VPIYVKPQSAALAAPGTYTGTFQVRWDWYFCSAISVASLCIGTTDTGSKTTTVTLTMTVAPNPTQVGIVASTTWDPVQSTTIPKAIPGSKLRMTMTVTNPDVVALDVNTVVLAFPTPSLLTIALDGDGTGASTIQMTQGSTPSGLTLSYVSPSSTSDNVDFSSDGGFTWTCYPVAGNAASQATVTHVRFRPQGTMAAGSSFSISIPYSVK